MQRKKINDASGKVAGKGRIVQDCVQFCHFAGILGVHVPKSKHVGATTYLTFLRKLGYLEVLRLNKFHNFNECRKGEKVFEGDVARKR